MGLLDFLFGKKAAKHARRAMKLALPSKGGPAHRKPRSDGPDTALKWATFQNPISRPEGLVRLGATSEVAGTHHRLDAAKAAVAALSRHKEVRSDLFREPNNPHDSNAVQVYIWTKFLDGELIGYLPRDQALALSRYPAEMPISCEISSIRTDGLQYFVKLIVLVPPKQERVRRGWER
ncbi:hypothetical protein FA743_17665 [Paracoccus gahaiensis]|uniref:HIRAN domain-containing protein n=1 Tax=Paracoccus gahaiensis TaxID=1706839 RepID=A0A4U0R4G9_9RHOB|nr:HIRAN domain-containing protein [Paracoccus gahaiensis]TJZ89803.1 hypothetical protein FA743_17665 [Paracoccus gahaiensis]